MLWLYWLSQTISYFHSFILFLITQYWLCQTILYLYSFTILVILLALPNNFVFVFIYYSCDTIGHTKQIGICIYLPIVVILLALPNNFIFLYLDPYWNNTVLVLPKKNYSFTIVVILFAKSNNFILLLFQLKEEKGFVTTLCNKTATNFLKQTYIA